MTSVTFDENLIRTSIIKKIEEINKSDYPEETLLQWLGEMRKEEKNNLQFLFGTFIGWTAANCYATRNWEEDKYKEALKDLKKILGIKPNPKPKPKPKPIPK